MKKVKCICVNYVIEVLEDIKNDGEENLCSGLWRLEKIPKKQFKGQLEELEQAIKLLQQHEEEK